MLNGKIFQDITGRNVEEFESTIEIWEEVKKCRQVHKFGLKQYGNTVVTPRGGIFALSYHDDDVDKHLLAL